ncbi:hypothetical protein M758_UG027100 [Ceratodon purpureus]|nr:hypothetical protein M758_UG027100 [Ceratodon purpureus]
MSSARVSSRVNKGKRGVWGSSRVTAIEPFVVLSSVSPVQKKKRGKRFEIARKSVQLDFSFSDSVDTLIVVSPIPDSTVLDVQAAIVNPFSSVVVDPLPDVVVESSVLESDSFPGLDLYNQMFRNLWNLLPPSPVNEEIESFLCCSEIVPQVSEIAPQFSEIVPLSSVCAFVTMSCSSVVSVDAASNSVDVHREVFVSEITESEPIVV